MKMAAADYVEPNNHHVQRRLIRVWLKMKELGLRGFSLCFHLPGFHFGYPFLTTATNVILEVHVALQRGNPLWD